MQHRQPWLRMHGRAGEIEVIAHANHIVVGKFVVEQRVGERAVTVVRHPG